MSTRTNDSITAAKRRVQNGAAVGAYKGAAAVCAKMPASAAVTSGRLLGRLLSHAMSSRRHLVVSHQQRLSPGLFAASPAELERRVGETFDSYAQYWVAMFRLHGKSRSEIDSTITIDGAHHIQEAVSLGSGAILAMPHIGAWDHGGAWLAGQYPLTVVAEKVDPPELFEWFCRQRAKSGMTVVPLDNDAGGKLIAALRRNEVVGLLCDRDIAGGGVEVEFFGEKTTLPAGPATLALRTGAKILPNAVYQMPGGRAHGVVRPAIEFERTKKLRADVSALTQLLAHELEALIRAAPHQWHVLQPNWPSDRAPTSTR